MTEKPDVSDCLSIGMIGIVLLPFLLIGAPILLVAYVLGRWVFIPLFDYFYPDNDRDMW